MNPNHMLHHAEYPPMIEPYRGPLVAPPLPEQVRAVRLYAPDYAPPNRRTVAVRESSPAASKVTFWSWLGLISSIGVATVFFLFSDYFRGWYPYVWCSYPNMLDLGIQNIHNELLTFLFLLFPCLLISLWSVAKRGQAYNPNRVLGVGLLVIAVDVFTILYIIHAFITLPAALCVLG